MKTKHTKQPGALHLLRNPATPGLFNLTIVPFLPSLARYVAHPVYYVIQIINNNNKDNGHGDNENNKNIDNNRLEFTKDVYRWEVDGDANIGWMVGRVEVKAERRGCFAFYATF